MTIHIGAREPADLAADVEDGSDDHGGISLFPYFSLTHRVSLHRRPPLQVEPGEARGGKTVQPAAFPLKREWRSVDEVRERVWSPGVCGGTGRSVRVGGRLRLGDGERPRGGRDR